ncbi:MAG: DUF59 domain-containing protein [Hyphomicrobiaceae bacterium]|nr:DUF59 domain-containing protein [Hyphomicrobiaceae bacterium]
MMADVESGSAAAQASNRLDDVWEKLSSVVDPELDEPVTDMKFISSVDVDDEDVVHVGFRLPTYWCAANFAFMMAEDMRSAIKALPWVKEARIVLADHMYADKINAGISQGHSFAETFGSEANGNLEEVRHTFLVKAYQRRQEALLQHLLKIGLPISYLASMSMRELADIRLKSDGRTLVNRYIERRDVVGSFDNCSKAFLTADGQDIDPDTMIAYLGALRRVKANAEFNGALCRGLLAVRFDMETPLSARKPHRDASKAASAEP